MRDVTRILMAAEAGGPPGFWLFLLIMAGVLVVILYLFFRSQPPSGPRMGE